MNNSFNFGGSAAPANLFGKPTVQSNNTFGSPSFSQPTSQFPMNTNNNTNNGLFGTQKPNNTGFGSNNNTFGTVTGAFGSSPQQPTNSLTMDSGNQNFKFNSNSSFGSNTNTLFNNKSTLFNNSPNTIAPIANQPSATTGFNFAASPNPTNTFGGPTNTPTFGSGANVANTAQSSIFGNAQKPVATPTFGSSTQSSLFGGNSNQSHSFGAPSNTSAFSGAVQSPQFGSTTQGSTFGNSSQTSVFGNNAQGNSFGNPVQNNTFGNSAQSNTFGNSAQSNTFGNTLQGSSFGTTNQTNAFTNNTQMAPLGNSGQTATFGGTTQMSGFSNLGQNNAGQVGTFGSTGQNNTGLGTGFGNSAQNTTFGSAGQNTTLGNASQVNTFGNAGQSNVFGSTVQNSTFSGAFGNASQASAPSNIVQNSAVTFGQTNTSQINPGTVNTFGNANQNSQFGNVVQPAVFGNVGQTSTFGNVAQTTAFGNSNSATTFGNTGPSNTNNTQMFGNIASNSNMVAASTGPAIQPNLFGNTAKSTANTANFFGTSSPLSGQTNSNITTPNNTTAFGGATNTVTPNNKTPFGGVTNAGTPNNTITFGGATNTLTSNNTTPFGGASNTVTPLAFAATTTNTLGATAVANSTSSIFGNANTIANQPLSTLPFGNNATNMPSSNTPLSNSIFGATTTTQQTSSLTNQFALGMATTASVITTPSSLTTVTAASAPVFGTSATVAASFPAPSTTVQSSTSTFAGFGQSAPKQAFSLNTTSTSFPINSTTTPSVTATSAVGLSPFQLNNTTTTSASTLGPATFGTPTIGLGGIATSKPTFTSPLAVSSTTAKKGLGGSPISALSTNQAKDSTQKDSVIKQIKDSELQAEFKEHVESFKKFVIEQKKQREEIVKSNDALNLMVRVEEECQTLDQSISEVSNGLQKIQSQCSRAKKNILKEQTNVKIAQSSSDPSFNMYGGVSESASYFANKTREFENRAGLYLKEIEVVESLTQSSNTGAMTAKELVGIIKNMDDEFISLAGQYYTVHERIKTLKSEYLRRLKPGTPNPFRAIEGRFGDSAVAGNNSMRMMSASSKPSMVKISDCVGSSPFDSTTYTGKNPTLAIQSAPATKPNIFGFNNNNQSLNNFSNTAPNLNLSFGNSGSNLGFNKPNNTVTHDQNRSLLQRRRNKQEAKMSSMS